MNALINDTSNTFSEVTAYWKESSTALGKTYTYAVIDAQGQPVDPVPGWFIDEHLRTSRWRLFRVDPGQLIRTFSGYYTTVEEAQEYAKTLTDQIHPPVGRWEKIFGMAHWYGVVYRGANRLPMGRPPVLIARPVDAEQPEGDWELLTLAETGPLKVGTLTYVAWQLMQHNLFPYSHPE